MRSLEDRKWRVFFLVALGIFMSTLDGSIVNIALPAIMKDLGGEFALTEWVVMVYLLTVTALLLSFGKFSDIFGRRWIYGLGFWGFTAGSLFCGLAGSTLQLIGFRALQGIGAAMLMACSPAIIVDVFPAENRGQALGLVGTVVAVGLTTGPALGGLLLHLFSWRAIFYINVPVGIFGGIVVFRILKGSSLDRGRREPFDWRGGIFISVCLGTFLLGITHAYEWGILSPEFILLLFISGAAGFGFARNEQRVANPVMSFDLFRVRLFILPVISAVFLFMALFAMVFLMPFYLMEYRGINEGVAGVLMVTPFVFMLFVSPVAGRLYDRYGSQTLCTVGLALLAAALFLLGRLSESSSYTEIIWRLALTGIGTAVFISPNTAAAMGAVGMTRRGVASGTVATARNLGMVLGIALSGAVFHLVFLSCSGGTGMSSYHSGLAPAFKSAFGWAMNTGCAFAVVGAILAYMRGAETAATR